MLDYLMTYYVEQRYGPGYVMTNIIYVARAVLLLNDIPSTAWGRLKKLGEIALCWLGTVLFCSLYYALLGHEFMDRVMMAALLVCYALFFSRYSPATRVVRSSVFFTATMLALPVSEPLGTLVQEIDPSFTWGEHLTPAVVAALTVLLIWFLRHFSTEGFAFVPRGSAALVVASSLLGLISQAANAWLEPPKAYNIVICLSFWVLELLLYYMFYVISREYDQNLELLAMQHKAEVDRDVYQVSQKTYEEMRLLRHEMKNHDAYVRSLLKAGEYDKLAVYLEETASERVELFQSLDCGNQTVNAAMNRAITMARLYGVRVETQIAVPAQLPYRESDLYSLLSNLMDNAVEGAAQSGVEDPDVAVRILPQRDYLFIRVTNPVESTLPARQRLTLRTTKPNSRAHGYGTKVIRMVAERYRGSVKNDIREGRFIADVMLELEEGKQVG